MLNSTGLKNIFNHRVTKNCIDNHIKVDYGIAISKRSNQLIKGFTFFAFYVIAIRLV